MIRHRDTDCDDQVVQLETLLSVLMNYVLNHLVRAGQTHLWFVRHACDSSFSGSQQRVIESYHDFFSEVLHVELVTESR